jgi:pilus assembly protein Flp/PilA
MLLLTMTFISGSTRMLQTVLNWRIWRDSRGQDLIEYALMAGFVAVAAGAIMPGVATSIISIFSQVNSIMVTASSS